MKDSCVTFGVIIGTRGIFNPQLAHGDKKKLLKTLDSLGYKSIILPENDTPSGNIETYQDAKKCASLFKKNQDKIDGILIILPIMTPKVTQLSFICILFSPFLNASITQHADSKCTRDGRVL